jgi:tetratricopeptide (TPR) repeat protein
MYGVFKSRFGISVVVLILLLTIPSTAADTFVEVKSKNFLIVGNASAKQVRNVAESLELFRWGFLRFFKIPTTFSAGTTVVVFRTEDDFSPFKPMYEGKPANIAGYFQGGRDTNFIALTADRQTPRVVYHELVHTLMADNFSGLPLWFQEGFAESFATLEVDASRIRIGRAIGEHVELLNQKRFMPLEKLFLVTRGSAEYNEAEKQGLFYAQSWALVHYLMLGDGGRHRPQLNLLLAGLRSGKAASEVFEDVFQTDLLTFQKTLEAYVQQRVLWQLLEIASEPQESGLETSNRVLSRAEWEFYLGDLLLHSDRLSEAESRLKQSMKLGPHLAGPQAAMGRLRMRQKNESEAISYFQRAKELDPGNHLPHYYHAAVLRARTTPLSDSDWHTLRSELMTTIELAPRFIEATEMLANVNLTHNVDIPQTIEILKRGLLVSNDDDNLSTLLAYALSRTARREMSHPTAVRAPEDSTALATKHPVRNIFDILDQMAAAQLLDGSSR